MLRAQKSPWENLSDNSLLSIKLCDLGLTLKDSVVETYIQQLYQELASKHLYFKPHVWISTEWFSPYGVAGFAVPFYLLHPRLIALEKQFMKEAEGSTENWCMQLLRHETGHAIDNAFGLRKSKRRQELFGLSGQPYPTSYQTKPYSRQFVRHLKNNYAQAHPDEDWAESFAVWLTPNSNWHNRYRSHGALKKLELVNCLMKRICHTKQYNNKLIEIDTIDTCQLTLQEYFDQKRQRFGLSRQPQIPVVLRQHLSVKSNISDFVPASIFLKTHKLELCQKIAQNNKQHHYIVMKAYSRIITAVAQNKSLGISATNKRQKKKFIKRLSLYIKNYEHRIAM